MIKGSHCVVSNRLSVARNRVKWAAFAAVGVMSGQAALAVTEADVSQSFAAGSTGYQANVPAATANLLNLAGTSLSASRAPNGGEGTSTDYAILHDGSVGTQPCAACGWWRRARRCGDRERDFSYVFACESVWLQH